MLGYFAQGISHITDLEGYDHMLFLIAMCAPYGYKDWRSLFLMATAFTLGHSLSLGLASFDVLRFSSNLIEALIPLTIMMTSLFNLRSAGQNQKIPGWPVYVITTLFGLIHGLGFSSYFRMIADDTGSMVRSLFLFNLGVEAGQLLIIAIYLVICAILLRALHITQRKLTKVISVLTLIISLYLFTEKIFT